MWIFACLIAGAYSLSFNLEAGTQDCVGLLLKRGGHFWGAYVVSGQGEKNFVARVEGPSGQPIYTSPAGQNEGEFETQAQADGLHKMCFKSTDRQPKVISFEFELEDETVDEDETAAMGSLDPIQEKFKDMARNMDLISRNIHFYQRREKVHRDLTEITCDRVLQFSIVKVVVLLGLTIFQVYMLTNFFEDRLKNVKPV